MAEEGNLFHHDVTVIGAGWSGLVACKYMKEEGLSVVCIERRDDIGGVWLYSDDTNVPTVMKTTCCTSSSTVTEMSDFPMAPEMGTFPTHESIMQYLREYADSFSLTPHIQLNTEVSFVEKKDNTWHTTCSNGIVYSSKHLVIATGVVQNPNRELENTLLGGFTGKIYHASEIKAPLEKHKGQRLLVLGGGETASDICTEWRDLVDFTYWSIPRGQHFFRKYAKVVPWGKPQALDKASSRMMKLLAPYHRGKPGLSWICKWTANGSLLAYQGHGIAEWKNDAKFFHFFFNKNGKVLDLVDYERLVPKGGITKCEGKKITFVDGTTQEFDLIITSTGYKVQYPYLPKRYSDVKIIDRHKFVFDVEDPSIVFIGLARPVVGSIVGISELQSRWSAKVFSGNIPIKSLEERRADVVNDTAHWREFFKDSSQRIEGLVEGYTYVDDIAQHAGIYPNYWELLWSNPRHWYIAVFSPYNASSHRLREPQHREKAIATLNSHRKGTLGPLHLLLILFLRLIWFDVWLVQLSSIKYRIQTARWWPSIRDTRMMRAIDHAWTFPKRVMFDNKSSDRDEHLMLRNVQQVPSKQNGRTVTHKNGTSSIQSLRNRPQK